MRYGLGIDDEAVEDLEALLEEFPKYLRNRVIDEVEGALLRFVSSGLKERSQHQYIPVHFQPHGKWVYWGAAYRYSADESEIVVTRIFKAHF